MTVLEVPLLWTTVERGLDGVAIALRGELSTATAPALESLLASLVDGRERLLSLDTRDAHIVPPAGERMLERWGAVPGSADGTYEFPASPRR